MSISALRRRLDRQGYGLRTRGGFFQIFDHETRGLVHNGGVDGFPLTLEDAVGLADYLTSPA